MRTFSFCENVLIKYIRVACGFDLALEIEKNRMIIGRALRSEMPFAIKTSERI